MEKIYFSYGMVKCGSTLAFEMIRTFMELSGFKQDKLPTSAGINRENSRLNFVKKLSPEQIAEIFKVTNTWQYPVALKTHAIPTNAVRKLLETGEALGHIVYRDPRDMALSLLDAGQRARLKGRKAFMKIQNLEDTFKSIDRQLKKLENWLIYPAMIPIKYDEFAFDTERAIKLFSNQMGYSADHNKVMSHIKENRFTQLNKGKKHRHTLEMDKAYSDLCLEKFGSFIEKIDKIKLERQSALLAE